MKKSQRLQPVKKIAAFKEQQAANAMGQAQRELAMRKARLEELVNYEREYIEGFQKNGQQGGVSAQQLLGYQAFLQKLRRAIKEQQTYVSIAEGVLADKQRAWLQTRQQSKIYANVEQRLLIEEEKLENKKEQKQIDEMANRLSQTRSGKT